MSAVVLTQHKGEARVDSRILAKQLRNQHKAVMVLIERYAAKFLKFGLLPFEMEAVKKEGARGAKHEKYALLNEDQSYFLLSLSRNTDHVVDLKANLVHAFSEARAGKDAAAIEYLPGYHELHDRAHELAAGSKNERFVHMNLNKLVNKTVGIGSGQRGKLPPPVKSLTVVAQTLAVQAMEGAKDHHDGYENAKRVLGQLGQALQVRSA